MHSLRQIQSLSPQARFGQQSTYGADYKPPSDRPLRQFRLHAETSRTTHQKLADMWAQYHIQCFRTITNGPQNPASAFTQNGRTVRAATLESENFSKIQGERTAPPEKGQSQIPPQRSSSDSGERRSASPSLSWTSVHNSSPSRSGPARKEAWTQATGNPELGVTTKAKDRVELPHSGEGLPFDSVTTYSQSYTHWDNPPTPPP